MPEPQPLVPNYSSTLPVYMTTPPSTTTTTHTTTTTTPPTAPPTTSELPTPPPYSGTYAPPPPPPSSTSYPFLRPSKKPEPPLPAPTPRSEASIASSDLEHLRALFRPAKSVSRWPTAAHKRLQQSDDVQFCCATKWRLPRRLLARFELKMIKIVLVDNFRCHTGSSYATTTCCPITKWGAYGSNRRGGGRRIVGAQLLLQRIDAKSSEATAKATSYCRAGSTSRRLRSANVSSTKV